MKQIKTFYQKEKRTFYGTIFLMILQSFGTLLLPFYVAKIIDNGILKENTNAIIQNGGWMFLMALLTGIVSIASSYYSAHLAGKFGHFLRMSLFKKTQDISLTTFEEFGTPTLLARTTNDINNIQQITMMTFQMILPAPIIILASIFLTGMVSWKMVWIPLIAIILFSLVAVLIIKKAVPLATRTQKTVDKMMLILREVYTGVRVIRAFDKTDSEKLRADQTFEKYSTVMIQMNRLFAVLNPIVNLAMGISIALILSVGGYQSLTGSIQVGSITAIIEYTILSLWFLTMATMVIVMVPRGVTSMQRIEQVLTKPQDLHDGQASLELDADAPIVASFNDVAFTYDGAEEAVLSNITFDIPRGKTTAIVGGTGSGKSTIAKALLRLKDVTHGQILLGEQDIRTLTQKDLRAQMSYVPQKAILLSGSIKDTLTFGHAEASLEMMETVTKVAQADDFIANLPHGFDSHVAQKGNNFSGGQKQRLSIARALIKPAQLYFFDDSFSALDYQTDAKLRHALKSYLNHAAVVIVAQRIATVMDADQIIVLDEGKIVGKGTHNELMTSCQTYQEFANSQGLGGKNSE